MEDSIVVTLAPFAMYSQATLMKDGVVATTEALPSNMTDMVNSLVALAFNNDVYNIKMQADKDLLDEIKSRVSKREQDRYEKNKIVIEGI